jgi:hypothetical protein
MKANKASKPDRVVNTAPPAGRPPEGQDAHLPLSRAARRPEIVRQRRQERLQAAERQQRQQRLTRIGVAAIAVLLAIGLGYLVFAAVQRTQVPEGTREFAVEAGHTGQTVAYDPTPPVGGEHDSTPYTCGFYSVPVRSENAVHSLEHGAVWVTYRPDLPAEQVNRLRSVAQNQSKLLVSPYPDLPAPVVASSWGRQLWLDSADDDRLEQFIERFRGAAPEPAAACVGLGTPE